MSCQWNSQPFVSLLIESDLLFGVCGRGMPSHSQWGLKDLTENICLVVKKNTLIISTSRLDPLCSIKLGQSYMDTLILTSLLVLMGISTFTSKEFVIFCRVSKIDNVIPYAKRPEEYAPSIWGLGRLGSYNEQICFKDFYPVHAHPKVKIIGVSSLFASHQIRVYLCLKSTAFVGSSYPNLW